MSVSHNSLPKGKKKEKNGDAGKKNKEKNGREVAGKREKERK
jgi:hypothetical protein